MGGLQFDLRTSGHSALSACFGCGDVLVEIKFTELARLEKTIRRNLAALNIKGD
jgi:hypothetical protein